jgi:hypothetical protein
MSKERLKSLTILTIENDSILENIDDDVIINNFELQNA